jgi:hypothetical protein
MENASELLVHFCRARQRYQERQRQTTEERSELRETYNSVTSLLTDSMRVNDQQCIRCVADDGKTLFIRLRKGQRRAVVMRRIEDVLHLVGNVALSVTHVKGEDLPEAISRLVESRARAQGTDVTPRVSVVPRVGIRATIVEQTNTCRELQALTSQMTQSHVERRRLRDDMQPIRRELQTAERNLCDTVHQGSSTELDEVVQMHTSTKTGVVSTKTVSVSTVVKPKKRNIFGLRNVCNCVREAVQCIQERDEMFDEKLRVELTRILERQMVSSQEFTRKVLVKRKRVPTAAPTPSRA